MTQHDAKALLKGATASGHWDTDEGYAIAEEYALMSRSDLSYGDRSDLAIANAVFLVGRDDLRLINFQTAAKERIRWLSVKLAIANRDNATLTTRAETAEAEVKRLREALTPSLDTKAAYGGEFKMSVELSTPREVEWRSLMIPWTTIKEIMAAIRDRALLKEQGE